MVAKEYPWAVSRRITEEAIEKVRRILEARRPALLGLAERLIEKEVIDADELKQIIEENSPSPVLVPGTATSSRKRLPAKETKESKEATNLPEAEAGG